MFFCLKMTYVHKLTLTIPEAQNKIRRAAFVGGGMFVKCGTRKKRNSPSNFPPRTAQAFASCLFFAARFSPLGFVGGRSGGRGAIVALLYSEEEDRERKPNAAS